VEGRGGKEEFDIRRNENEKTEKHVHLLVYLVFRLRNLDSISNQYIRIERKQIYFNSEYILKIKA